MKSKKYQKRFYREWVCPGALHEARLCVRETDVHILADRPVDEPFCRERIRAYRGQIEDYISYKEPRFFSSLSPVPVEAGAPAIVRAMAAQSRKADVGPMAAVAGAIAQFLGKDLLRLGYGTVIVENGGDIFLRAERKTTVGIYAGRSRFSRALSLSFAPEGMPLGVCTSSGTIGHSLSFGNADSVTIVAGDALLADACATAVGNRVKVKKDLAGAIGFARSVRGVRGALVIMGDSLASWGAIELS